MPASTVGAVDDAGTQARAARDGVALLVALGVRDRQLAGLVAVLDVELAGDLGELRLALRLAGLEQLGDTREAVGDVLTRDATGVERTHRQLRAGLADRLGGDDADRGADVDGAAGREVPAVAALADAVLRVAGHDGAALDRLDAELVEVDRAPGPTTMYSPASLRTSPVFGCATGVEQAAADEVVVDLAGLLRVEDREERRPRRSRSPPIADDDVLRDVDETAGQVARVGGTQRGVGETLAGAVRRDEVLENGQALAEVRLDRAVEDLALRVRHQASHAGQLADLLDVTAGSGVGHHVDGVELVEVRGHGLADVFVRLRSRRRRSGGAARPCVMRPRSYCCSMLPTCSSAAASSCGLLVRDLDVVDGDGDAGAGRVVEAEALDLVEDARPSASVG